ncbi:MAG: hypothetical protein L0287_37150 [Anaerolineae bacterium]|nr:hypothetical protein [Anaerolineae bacterium]MCI0698835.1 hypothetical protein [candidate division KSB1 bacterium]
MNNPALTIGNKIIAFPVNSNPRNENLNAELWEYVEFDGIRYRKYDGNNNLTGSQGFVFPWRVPRVAPGCNTLTYTHNGSNSALVRILLEGPAEFSG